MNEARPLWAPWRIAFIRTPKEDHCFLCGNREPASDKAEEELIVRRGREVFVMLNRYPYTSGHLMIAPYRHVGELSDLTDSERHELIDMTAEAKRVLDALLHPDACNAGLNLGKAAGAGVAEHLHMHLVPRWVGDTNFMPVIADVRCVPEAIADTARYLRDGWEEARRRECAE